MYQRIRDDRDSVNPLEITEIYQINYRQKEGGAGAYISKTKSKIKECIAEHKKRDIKLNEEITVLAKLNRIEDIEIDFIHIKKSSNYKNHNYDLKHESLEIIADNQCCNFMEHTLISRLEPICHARENRYKRTKEQSSQRRN